MWDSIYSAHDIDFPCLTAQDPYLWVIEFDMSTLQTGRVLPVDYNRAVSDSKHRVNNMLEKITAFSSLELPQFTGAELVTFAQPRARSRKC